MDPLERLLPDQEKIRYDIHNNDDTEGYRRFLGPIVQEVQNYSVMLGKPAAEIDILDYGCGPTAFLSKLLKEVSFQASNYDVYYFTDQNPLQKSYHVITSTEVWEHFYHPLEEITQLIQLLKSHGLLAIMTSAHSGLESFPTWHYRRDPTHVVFFSEKTMRWIADKFSLELTKAQSPYWIFQKKS